VTDRLLAAGKRRCFDRIHAWYIKVAPGSVYANYSPRAEHCQTRQGAPPHIPACRWDDFASAI